MGPAAGCPAGRWHGARPGRRTDRPGRDGRAVDPLGGSGRPDLGADQRISLQDYGELARDAQARGINYEAGMITLAQEPGWDPADTKAALDGWVQPMGQSVAVGQQFRKFLGY
jgi:hypothetical protein